jgi:6-phosphogluconolactonase
MRRFLPVALVCFLSLDLVSMTLGAEGKERIYFGTYGQTEHDGIFVAELDLATGVVTEPRLAAQAVNASFVAPQPSRKRLYAVAEVSTRDGQRIGGVIAFEMSPETGDLARVNDQPSGGAGPCHLTLDRTGTKVLVANYEGSVAVLPLDGKARLRPVSTMVTHGRTGPDALREASHAHSVNVDSLGRFALVADLGSDKIFVYRLETNRGGLEPAKPPWYALAPGAGPRHLAFDPSGRFVYVIDELDSTITVFSYMTVNGSLSRIQVTSTLPKDFHGENAASEVAVHPSGKFVYGANRGHDSLAIFSVDPASGKLTAEGHEPTQGKTPRHFAIDPKGAYLLAANQASDSVVVFRIDSTDGRLHATGQKLRIHQPVCVRYVELRKPMPREGRGRKTPH